MVLEGICSLLFQENDKTGVKTTSLKAKVGAVFAVPGSSAQSGFGTELSSAVRRQVSKEEADIFYGPAGGAEPFC